MNIQDRRKTLTVEELRRRYNLDALDKDRKAIKLQKDQLTKVDAELNDFVEITTKNLKELQDQVDGNITTWFFNGVPKVENEPASNWTTDIDKNNHLGDLYYDQDTGYAYRWAYENNTYVWSKIVDADVVEALAVANSAQDTADSKRRVFVVQPKPPYDIGDIWIKEDTDLYRCRASRSEGNFNTADWIRATNYTDDTVALGTKAELDQFKTQVTENYVSNATLETTVNSITGKVEETYTYITTVENQVNDITTTTQTSTGDNNLYITDALESNALEYHIEGKSEQETRSGKNLFISLGSKSTSGITVKENNDGTYDISGTAVYSIEYTNFISLYDSKIIDGETYILSANKDLPTGLTARVEMYTDTTWLRGFIPSIGTINKIQTGVANTTNATRVRFGIFIASGTTLDIKNIGFQLEKGSTATEYEQYGVSPSPDYPSEIKTVKGIENLFDKDDVFLNKQWNGSTLSESEVANASPKIPVIGGKKYKRNVGYNANIFIKNDGSFVDIQGATNTIVAPENSKYWIFNIPKEVDVNTIIAVQGDTISDYVPYGAWAKVKVNGKNILKIKDFTLTQNGITLKCENGVFKVSGTSTGMPTFFITNYVNINELNSMLSGKTLTISSSIPLTNKPNFNIGATGNFYWAQVNNGNSYCTRNLDSNTKISTVYLYFGGASGTVYNEEFTIQIEQGTEATEYEEYKENEALIDLNKPNLFDVNSYINDTSNTGYYSYSKETGITILKNDNRAYDNFEYQISVKPNTTYHINLDNWLNVSQIQIMLYSSTSSYIGNTILTENKTITVGATCYYIKLKIMCNSYPLSVGNLAIKEGYEDYYELSSIGDTKDKLSIIDGQVVIDKKIGKVVLNGSENNWVHDPSKNRFVISLDDSMANNKDSTDFLCTHFKATLQYGNTGTAVRYGNMYFFYNTEITSLADWTNCLSENPIKLYYPLAEAEEIILPNVNIPLFEGVNHISLVEDVETTTSIKFLRQTPISGEYATNQQLSETNYNLANTTSKTNENTLNLNATNTNLNNNYYTKPQIDIMNTATTEEITTIKKEVETKITAEDLTIAINQIKTTGATSVETTTGYKFNEEGLSIQKSGSEMSSLLDNDGLVVKRNDTEMLTVRSSGVEAENITVRTYFTIGDNTRAENYKGGTGFFYIGGDD